MALSNTNSSAALGASRVRLWYGALLIVFMIFGIRLFYIQIIRHNYYKTAALSGQLKQYEIPARRGDIKTRDGNQLIPIVLNQKLYTLYADPVYIKDAEKVANKVSPIIGVDAVKLTKQLKTPDTRYVILGKKLSQEQNKMLLALKFPGIGTQSHNFRTYPQGDLAAQLLGFVDDEGNGRYGIEQSLDGLLKGKVGQMRAITDAQGVPLAANQDNTQVPAVEGDDIVLTLDLAIQQQLQSILQEGVKSSRATGGSAVIMDVNSGAVKAMANYPSYDPAKYNEVENAKLFTNPSVSEPIEVGSILKPLTTAAALDSGAIRANSSYYDPASWLVDGFRITNIEEDGGAAQRTVTDILNYSLNTGVTWQLMQMGGGKINEKARQTWFNYMSNSYRFGMLTGIEQGYEAEGYIPPPEDNGAGINLTYANTTFGQAMTATPIQMAGAMSAILNGGTYYQPHLVSETIDSTGKAIKKPAKILASNIVSPKTAQELIPMMQHTINERHLKPAFDQNRYTVGGKTGTAQIAKPGGGYYDDRFNGTYLGFVGGDTPQYVIVVFVDKPTNGGYAGSAAAQPIFVKIAHTLIDESLVTPKTR